MKQEVDHERQERKAVLAIAAVACATATMLSAAYAADPCCGVLGVDRARGMVTAYEYASGNVFRFSVKNKAVLARLAPCRAFEAKLAGLKDGQTFASDLGGANPADPVNEARRTAHKAAGKPTPAVPPNEMTPAEPCCEMTSAPGTAGRVLGVQSHAKFEGVEILLTELKRSGGSLVTATCLYCNNGAKRVDLAADLRARAQGKAKLLDTDNRIEYQVARVGGPHGQALMSDHGPGLKLQPGQSARSWVKFAAPASDKASVVWPGASEPFEDVPIAK